MLQSIISNGCLTAAQADWLSLPAHSSEVPFIIETWEKESAYGEEAVRIAVRIAVDAWRLHFLDSWDEQVIDRILAEWLPPENQPHMELYKQHVQLQMSFEREDEPDAVPFRHFLKANLEFNQTGLDLAVMPPMDGEQVFDVSSGISYVFRKGWPAGTLTPVSKNETE